MDYLAKEIYKFLQGLSSLIINNIFKVSDNTWNLHYFHLHKLSFIYSTSKKTVKFGHQTITYRGHKILNLLPASFKNVSSLENLNFTKFLTTSSLKNTTGRLILDFNPFSTNAPFVYPLKTSQNRRSDREC